MTDDKAKRRATFFRAFNAECVARNDVWCTSVPNSDVVTIEVTPGSGFPAELRERGFPIERDDPRDGHRIIGRAIREVVAVNRDGSISPLPVGSTTPQKTIDHAGIVRVIRYRFNAP
jgi:hypothetical protein